MRRRKTNKPRAKRTLIPAFDPEALAKELAHARPTSPPPPPSGASGESPAPAGESPTDASSPSQASGLALGPLRAPDESLTPSDEPSLEASIGSGGGRTSWVPIDIDDEGAPDSITREMYRCFLSSDFPDALAIAEILLDQEPDNVLAELVANRCRVILATTAPAISPSSILRLTSNASTSTSTDGFEASASPGSSSPSSSPSSSSSLPVLSHIDGVSDAATIAQSAGLSTEEALQQLSGLVRLGIVEIVAF